MKKLAFFGAIEVQEARNMLPEEEKALLRADSGDTYELRGDLEKLRGAIAALTPFAPKKSMLKPRPQTTQRQMEQTLEQRPDVMRVVEEVLELQRKRAAIAPDTAKLEGNIVALQPWAAVDLPLRVTETRMAGLMYGTFPVATDMNTVFDKTLDMECSVNLVSADESAQYVLVFFHKGAEDEVLQVLREMAFSRISFREFNETPAQEIVLAQKRIEENARALEALDQELATYADRMPAFQLLYDTLNGWLTMGDVRTKLLVSEQAFFMTGYIPDIKTAALEKDLEGLCVAYSFDEVTEEDNVPVLIKNSKLIEPYEMVTELYGLPLYGGMDPTAKFAPFFLVFFGIMFGDIAYGLMMIAAGLVVLNMAKPSGTMKKMFGLVLQGGIASTIVGVITGSFFGDVITVFSSTFLSKTVVIKAMFNPLESPMEMLYFSCALGMIHLLWGMALKFYLCLKEKDYAGAFFDIGCWWVLFAGIGLLAVGIPAGPYVAIGGAVGLVLTQGRAKKGIISKLFSGILSLYDITGYLGDVLSYARLMALMLSSAVIASVFNSIGALFGGTIVGLIVFVLVFLIGHFVNIFTGGLGAYVHASRLQYVEFFGKFYDSGGRPFEPYAVKTQYHTLTFEEEN